MALKRMQKSHVFWIFENVASMSLTDRNIIICYLAVSVCDAFVYDYINDISISID